MKNFRSTVIFAVIVAAIAAFTIWDTKRSEHEKESKEEQSRLIKFKEDNVTGVEILGQGVLTKLEKSGDTWKLMSPVEDSADAQAVTSMVSELLNEKSMETVAEGDAIDPKVYGLDQPSYTLTVTANDGKREEITVGSVKAFDSNLYVQVDKEKKVLLAPMALADQLSKPARDYRNKRLFRGEGESKKIDAIEIALHEKNRKDEFKLVKKEGGGWEMKGVADALPLSEDAIDAYIRQVREARATDFTGESASDAKVLAKDGLANPEFALRFFEANQPRFELKFAASQPSAASVLVASSDVKEVATALPSVMASLKKSPEDFFDKKAPFRFTIGDVTRMSIRAPQSDAQKSNQISGEFEKKGDDWGRVDKGLQTPVDSAKLKALVEALSKLEAARFLGPVKTAVPLKKPTTIELLSAKGERLLELAWGEKVTEKTQGDVEATFYPARTNQSSRVIMLTSAAISGLDLAALAAKPSPTPSPSPSPMPTK